MRSKLATDMRAEKYGGDFPARAIHRIPSATLTSRSPLAVAATFTRLGFGYAGALRLLLKVKPAAVIGFGGYPTLPPIIAASTLRIPTAIHEQNAVMGRANRLLARFVDRIGLSFMPTKLLAPEAQAKARLTGIPVRDAVLKFRDVPYAAPDASSRLLLLVFGGSQGARFFSEALPPALLRLPADMRGRLTIVQQAREEDLAGLREAYVNAKIAAHLAPFFRDLPERIANAQLVIARAGASTVAELTAIGRPCLLVPLPTPLTTISLKMQHGCKRLAAAGAYASPSFRPSAWRACCKICCPRRSVWRTPRKRRMGWPRSMPSSGSPISSKSW